MITSRINSRSNRDEIIEIKRSPNYKSVLSWIFNMHYLSVIVCYIYLKSFEGCNQDKYDCDFYYDKWTILQKILMIISSGALNGLLILWSGVNYCSKYVFVESVSLAAFALIFNIISSSYNIEKFDYTGTCYTIGLLSALVIFSVFYFIYKVSFINLFSEVFPKKILIIQFFLKSKLIFLSENQDTII
jgi:hypothetical protein